MKLTSLIESLTLIEDHRSDNNKRYTLPLFLLIVFCASISKHDSWYTMQDHAQFHAYNLKALYMNLFGMLLEHVPPRMIPSIEPCNSSLISSSKKLITLDLRPLTLG